MSDTVTIPTLEASDGMHPSEALVAIECAKSGRHEVFISRRLIEGDRLRCYPKLREGDLLLVELAQETMRGSWRVWAREWQP